MLRACARWTYSLHVFGPHEVEDLEISRSAKEDFCINLWCHICSEMNGWFLARTSCVMLRGLRALATISHHFTACIQAPSLGIGISLALIGIGIHCISHVLCYKLQIYVPGARYEAVFRIPYL